jgi:hypothetical protein
MLGFLIGTVCLVGLVKTLRWGRHRGGCGYGRHGGFGGRGFYGDHGYGGYGGYGSFGGFGDRFDERGWGGPSVFLRMLFRRLETTPGQEKVIVAAFDEMRAAAREARGEARTTRADLAKAMRGPAIDEVLFGEMFARHDAAMEKVRKAGIGAIAKVHDALDERQRARLADLIESGPGAFRGGPWAGESYAF